MAAPKGLPREVQMEITGAPDASAARMSRRTPGDVI